ncbi:transposase [Microtetraspora malaysiensis]|uniref:transposase n=1 Tax=Microtetraspora malaysiensis TaxID=161358 RepID=UPI003D8AE03A
MNSPGVGHDVHHPQASPAAVFCAPGRLRTPTGGRRSFPSSEPWKSRLEADDLHHHDKVIEGMAERQNRLLDPVDPDVSIDAIHEETRDGQAATRAIYVALAVTLTGRRGGCRCGWLLGPPGPARGSGPGSGGVGLPWGG